MTAIKNEIKSFSKPFKYLFFALFLIYIGAWIFTIHLSGIQKKEGYAPLLPVLYQDSHEYADLAQSLLLHHTFIQPGEDVETLRAPGYASFVAVFYFLGRSYFLVTLVQIFLVFLSALIIRRLGGTFFSLKTGEIAGIIFLLSPMTLNLSLIILTDILFLFLFLLGFYIAVSLKKDDVYTNKIYKIIGSSVLFACAIYVRPMGEFALPLFALPFLASGLSWKGKIKSLVVMVCVILLCVAPWVVRNYRLTGVADFTSFKAVNLVDVVLPIYIPHATGISPTDERKVIVTDTGIPENQWRNLAYSKRLADYAEKILLAHPFGYLAFHTESSLPFLFSSSVQDLLYTYHSAMHDVEIQSPPSAIQYLIHRQWKLFFASITAVWWKITERVILIFIYIVAVVGLWIERRNLVAWACACIPAYLMLLAGPAANARYAIQVMPYMLLLFGVGVTYLVSRYKTKLK